MDPEFLKTPDELNVYGTELYNLIVPFSSAKYKYEPKTILQVVDDVFYFWSPKEFCVVTVFQRDLIPVFNGKYQLLRPNLPIDYEVTGIVVNETSTKLAVVCDCRIMILKIPERRGPGCYFLAGMHNILCSAMYVDWVLGDTIGRVRWVNDFLIILYDGHVEIRDCSKENGPREYSWPAKNIVDFELLLPIKDEKYYKPESVNRISILLLKENGDVHTVNFYITGDGLTISIESIESIDYEGLVSMYPPPEDNYGVEAYSILLLEGMPKKLVIASRIGVLNHFVLLTKEKDKPFIPTPELFLYAVGIVELDLTGLKFDITEGKEAKEKKKKELNESMDEGSIDEESSDEFMSAIALIHDDTSHLRYFVLHKAGIHCITVPRIDDYQEYVKALESTVDKPKLSITADCIVVTRSNLSRKSHAPFGAACVDVKRPFLIMVYHKSIKSKYYHRGSCVQIPTTEHDLYAALERVPTVPYIDLVGYEDAPSMTKLELLCLIENHFRSNVFPHYKCVKKMMNYCMVKASKLKLQQLAKLEEIMEDKNVVQSKAEQLAEKCEEFNEKNNVLSERLYECVKRINYLEPDQRCEKQMRQVLDLQTKALEKLKIKFSKFYEKVELFRAVAQRDLKYFGFNQDDSSECRLSEEQVKRMQDILGDMSKQIDQNIDSVEKLPAF
ncbi:hypothetical protein LSTR_LSTR006667 [Laodelphax striatellus]|uniref:Nucleoporin Nup88 n=1 Tax=Laodelphax striatellus TaxID=195883 RepID=A0A482X8E9_LAOST|nr:hypothetical protein LSTR_LSTR006667 [Laodelphax striatellus]